jgi:hypothetical protein
MQISKSKRLAIAAPAMGFPIFIMLARAQQQDFLLGLSSSYWAGLIAVVTIGTSLLAGIAANRATK